MAIGGMIGGGIFSVLGVTIELAGHLAFVCFVLAGAIALVTAHSYAGLTRRAGRSGGPYAYLCEAGHPQLGALASWYLVLGYVLALAVSAINATLFSTARLVRDLSRAGELPARLGRTVRGLPTSAMWALAVFGAVFAMLPGINDLLAFGSVTFLGVFGLMNHLHARTADRLLERALGHLGSIACGAAVMVLLVDLAATDPFVLAFISGCVLAVGALRYSFVRLVAPNSGEQ